MPPVRVAALADLPLGKTLAVKLKTTPIILVNVAGVFYALHDRCSHANAHLSHGDLDSEALTMECPLHGARFDLQTGHPRSLPATKPVKTYTVYAEGDDLFVDFDD